MAQIAISLVLGLGATLLSRLFQPKPKDIYGARLNDLNVAGVSPGNPIIKVFGQMKVPGQMIWTTPLSETVTTTESSSGKMGMSPQQKTITTTYSVCAAWAICQGPIAQINRIWANQKLLWINTAALAAEGETFDTAYYAELDRLCNQEGMTDYSAAYVSAYFFAWNNFITYGMVPVYTMEIATAYVSGHPAPQYDDDQKEQVGRLSNGQIPPPTLEVMYLFTVMTGGWNTDVFYLNLFNPRYAALNVYTGTDSQMPDPILQQYMGVGAVSGYRNTAYVVIDTLQLADFGNAVPTLTFEVVTKNTPTYLHDVVEDICYDAGLDADEYDSMGSLNAQPIVGYAITQPKSARESITEMQKVYPFDAFDSGFILKTNWINQREVAYLDRRDLGAHVYGEALPASDQETMAHEFDLPKRYNLAFQEPVRDFSMNRVWAVREVTNSNTVLDNEVTMALTRQDAKTWCEQQLALRFLARRTYKRFLPRKYIILEPGDAVLMPEPGDEGLDPIYWRSSRLIEKVVGKNGIIEATFMDHSYQTKITSAMTADDQLPSDGGSIPGPTATYGFLFDTSLLLDSDADLPGFYSVLAGNGLSWPGGVLEIELDSSSEVTAFGETGVTPSSGTNYYPIAQSSMQVAAGYATSTLMTNKHEMSWDTESEILVLLLNRTMTLNSISRSTALLMPVNVAMVGNEIIQFCDATNKGNGIWSLKTILRGLRGTEWAMGAYDATTNPQGHQAGEYFVQLISGGYQRLTHSADYLNSVETFKAITSGADLAVAPSFTFADTGNSLRPRAPQLLSAYQDAAYNRYFVWTPRARQNGAWISGETVALDQATESYQIDVVQGGAVKMTYYLGAVRAWAYSAAMQSSDHVTDSSPITFRLYQMGATIGRGFPATATV